MGVEIEKIKVKGINLKSLLNKNFMEEMKKNYLDVDYVSIISFVKKKTKNEKIKFSPLVFVHAKPEEIEKKELHIEVGDTENIKKIQNVLKKIIK